MWRSGSQTGLPRPGGGATGEIRSEPSLLGTTGVPATFVLLIHRCRSREGLALRDSLWRELVQVLGSLLASADGSHVTLTRVRDGLVHGITFFCNKITRQAHHLCLINATRPSSPTRARAFWADWPHQDPRTDRTTESHDDLSFVYNTNKNIQLLYTSYRLPLPPTRTGPQDGAPRRATTTDQKNNGCGHASSARQRRRWPPDQDAEVLSRIRCVISATG
jgi:hypothetical protein